MKTETRKKYAEEFVGLIKNCNGDDACLKTIAYTMIDTMKKLVDTEHSRARAEQFAEWCDNNFWSMVLDPQNTNYRKWKGGFSGNDYKTTSELFDEYLKHTGG